MPHGRFYFPRSGTNPRRCACARRRNHANGRTFDETHRPDWSRLDCFAGHERIRFRQARHGADGRGRGIGHSGQAWTRSRPRASYASGTRTSLRMAPGPWSPQARLAQGPRPPPLTTTLRWIRVRHPIARAMRKCSGTNGSRPRGAAGSAGRERCTRLQPSSISTAIRIRSEWFLAPSFCLSSEVVLATVL